MANNKKCKCVVCGKDFLGQKSTAKYCGRECQSIDYKNRGAINHITKTLYYKTCELCGKEYDTYSKSSRFCSGNCKTKEYRLRTNTLKKIVPCDNCGKEIERYNDKRATVNFCCNKCQREYYNSPNKIFKCKECGEECSNKIYTTLFCSKECEDKYSIKHNYYKNICDNCGKEYWTKKPKRRFCSIKCSTGGLSNGNTKPHQKIYEIIKDIYKVDTEYKVRNYYIDMVLNDKFAIEINGTFWHTDPRKYIEITYEDQYKNINRDISKNQAVFEDMSVSILYLWEYDINNNIELCVELIKYYITNNGDIPYYDSFNYHLENGVITVNEQIIKPYREYSLEELNKITGLND